MLVIMWNAIDKDDLLAIWLLYYRESSRQYIITLLKHNETKITAVASCVGRNYAAIKGARNSHNHISLFLFINRPNTSSMFVTYYVFVSLHTTLLN